MNQQKIIRKLSFLFLACMVMYACKKEQYSPEKQTTIVYETAVQNWKQQHLLKASKKTGADINFIVSNLDYTSAATVSLANTATLFLIRVKGTEVWKASKYLGIISKNGNYAFDGLYQAGSIERIVSFFETNKLPAKDSILVWKLNARPMKGWTTTENGKIITLSVNAKLHGDKTIIKTTAVTHKPNDYQVAQEVCIDWYWTVYDEDGYIISETYAYTTCESSGGGGGGNDGGDEDYGRIALKVFDANPGIPGNDSTKVRGSIYLEGAYGLFRYAYWSGSQALWMERSWSYIETSNTATINNAQPSPRVTAGFTGAITTPNNVSYTFGLTRQYTYTQAFP
jgi:hypothetical protein